MKKNNYLFLMKLHAHCQYGNTVPKQWTHFDQEGRTTYYLVGGIVTLETCLGATIIICRKHISLTDTNPPLRVDRKVVILRSGVFAFLAIA